MYFRHGSLQKVEGKVKFISSETNYFLFKSLLYFLYGVSFLSQFLLTRNEREIKSLVWFWETSALSCECFLYNVGNTISFLWLFFFFRSFAMKSTCVMTIVFSKVKGMRSDLNHLLSKNA